ncbi:GtrA family protein [Actinokineospora diospyrosa]|uniref:Flippase GtrA (Transmembrane translocase of bactoprenol-linked glucose) n=1 Tax=Actinokineospora diospyrosa TaxID=103728 RepID=A0ABT1IFJ9_9PSEU|nr:GtrA family protein [Actinokineospora diospyrosa]MCP2271423.1 putative flippase GtrA (transmembrane translocase of bactoprenol-linked glucose) [Actinokineospora diospyrosa]
MPLRDVALRVLPARLRPLALKHRELLKFGVVGSVAYLVDNGTWYLLKLTVLEPKPVVAKAIGVILATIVSYILNREWSFDTRGGRERHHEAALFFAISGASLFFYTAPLYLSRYVFDLEQPHVSALSQEVADFLFGSIVGTVIAMVFRWWAFKKWVFPNADARAPRRDRKLGKLVPYTGPAGVVDHTPSKN